MIMSPNIFFIQNKIKNNEKVEKGLLEAGKYAWDIIEGRSHWGRFPIISDALYYVSLFGLKLTHSNLNQKYFSLNWIKINTVNVDYATN